MIIKFFKSIFNSNDIEQKSSIQEVKKDLLPVNTRFEKWIEEINLTDLPKDDIIAFNFGLFESADSYMMYLIGSKKYDVNDENWATIEDYSPKKRYLDLFDLELNGSKWEVVLEFSLKILKEYSKMNEFENSFLSRAEYITTGFDDGNLVSVN